MILTRKSKTVGFDSVAIDKMFSINGGSYQHPGRWIKVETSFGSGVYKEVWENMYYPGCCTDSVTNR